METENKTNIENEILDDIHSYLVLKDEIDGKEVVLPLDDEYKEIKDEELFKRDIVHDFKGYLYKKYEYDTNSIFVHRKYFQDIENEKLRMINYELSKILETFYQRLLERVLHYAEKRYINISTACGLLDWFAFLCNEHLNAPLKAVLPGFHVFKQEKELILEKATFEKICIETESSLDRCRQLKENSLTNMDYVLIESSSILSLISAMMSNVNLAFNSVNLDTLYINPVNVLLTPMNIRDALYAKVNHEYYRWLKLVDDQDLKTILNLNMNLNPIRKIKENDAFRKVMFVRKKMKETLGFKLGFTFAMLPNVREVCCSEFALWLCKKKKDFYV
jgi:hypothetical protein